MNPRRVCLIFSLTIGVGMVGAVALRRTQLVNLRADLQKRTAKAAVPTNGPAVPPGSSAAVPSESLMRELLQLRNQVAQLRRQRDELLPVRADHQRLELQLATRDTNGIALPANYVRKAQARFVGYNTPEDALQSFLWALQNHDVSNYLRAITPEAARYYESNVPRSGTFAKLFDDSRAFISFSIVHTHQSRNGMMQVDLQLLPGLPPISVNLQQLENQWKISSFP